MTERGNFFVVEGPDASGKATQAKLAEVKLRTRVERVLAVDFPRYYDSPWGKLIGQLLSGEYGDFMSITPYLTALPYMIDEYVWSRDEGRPFINNGGWILSDRYFTSNVHQVAKMKGEARAEYRKWLWTSGYDDLGILKPDLVLFLDVHPKIARELNKQKQGREYLGGEREDLAEKDYEHQVATYNEYLHMVECQDEWVRVMCVTQGGLDDEEVIHQRVWNEIENRLF
jgi:dTMP kinase